MKANTGLADLNPRILNFSVTWRSVSDIKPWHQYQFYWSVCGPRASL